MMPSSPGSSVPFRDLGCLRSGRSHPRKASARAMPTGSQGILFRWSTRFGAFNLGRRAVTSNWPIASSAVRAAGHAATAHAATAHVATRAPYAAAYAVKAAAQTAGATSPSSAATEEREWQYRRRPDHLRPMAFPT
jgi:hypothetical protein